MNLCLDNGVHYTVTVHTQSLNRPDDFILLEQNYEYDLMNANKLLDKYVGKKIKLIDWNKFQDRKEVVEATLLSNNQGQIYKINDEIYLGHPGYKVLPEIPENLIAKPTLMWLYGNFSISWGRLHFATIHWIPAFAGMTGIYIQTSFRRKPESRYLT